ncbi:MAG TPA: ribosome biogenesis GTPase Der [bacterium]|nr:ribosome biogenesis GTPase Der [bacterium]
MGLPTVAIVGRPNVGKSSLFNRLLSRRHAIVSDVPGITRDRLEAPCRWRGREFLLVDTGGLVPGDPEPLVVQVRRQAERAIASAHAVLFVVDAVTGLTPQDEEIADALRRGRRPVMVIANKVDTPALAANAYEFHALGLGEPIMVSATHGLGIGELLDAVIGILPDSVLAEAPEETVGVVFLGRPNVGKSSLVNALLGEERVIVDARPGTTRDAIDISLRYDGRPVTVIDTAGLRRRSRVVAGVEYYSTRRTHDALSRADVAVLVVDAVQGITDQDQRIARTVYEAGRASVIAVNKWDLLSGYTPEHIHRVAQQELRFLGEVLVCLTVAVRGEGISHLMAAVFRAADARATRIATGPLNRLIDEAVRANNPPANATGRHLHIYYATQPTTKPPAFVLFVDDPNLLTDGYRRYLEGRMRATFDLAGTPVRWVLRRRRPPAPARTTR